MKKFALLTLFLFSHFALAQQAVNIPTASQTTPIGEFTNVNVVPATAPSITAVTPQIAGAVTYSYRVVAYFSDGTHTEAGPVGTTTTGAADLTAPNSGNTITWGAVTGATTYEVWRTASGGVPASTGKLVDGLTATTYLDTGIAAQEPSTVIDGFENPADGWTVNNISGCSNPWLPYEAGGTHPNALPVEGTALATFRSYSINNGCQARIQKDTPISISAIAPSATLSFYMARSSAYPANADRIQVQISTNNGVNWTNIGPEFLLYSSSVVGWENKTLDLSAYLGQNINIGFLGISGYGDNIHLDNVQVTVNGPSLPTTNTTGAILAANIVGAMDSENLYNAFDITNDTEASKISTGTPTTTGLSIQASLEGTRRWVASTYDSSTYKPFYYSSEGRVWTRADFTGMSSASDIQWNGEVFVAIGGGPTYNLAYSYDGIEWTGVNLADFSWINTILWNGSQFVIGGIATGNNSIATSPDGINWTGAGKPLDMPNVTGIRRLRTTYYVIGSGGTHTLGNSNNLSVWNAMSTVSTFFHLFCVDAFNICVAFSTEAYGFYTWSEGSSSPAGRSTTGMFGTIPALVRKAIWAKDRIIAVGNTQTIPAAISSYAYSFDGLNWYNRDANYNTNYGTMVGIGYDGETLITGTNSQKAVVLSSDLGSTWMQPDDFIDNNGFTSITSAPDYTSGNNIITGSIGAETTPVLQSSPLQEWKNDIGDTVGSINSKGELSVSKINEVSIYGDSTGDIDNLIIGIRAKTLRVTGGSNTVIGINAAPGVQASNVTAIGAGALSHANAFPSNSTAVGASALFEVSDGTYNTGIGANAGRSVILGEKNTFIGASTDTSLASLQNSTALGYAAYVGQNNTMVFGDINVTDIFAGTNKQATVQAKALQLNTAAKPACDATKRGTFWYVAGATDVADTVEVCRKDGSNAYAWVSLY